MYQALIVLGARNITVEKKLSPCPHGAYVSVEEDGQ